MRAWCPRPREEEAPRTPLRAEASAGADAEALDSKAWTDTTGIHHDAIQAIADIGLVVGTILRARAAIRLPKQIPPAAAAGSRVHAAAHRICKPAVSAMDVQVSRLAACRSVGCFIAVGTTESLDPANAVLPYRCLPARSSHLRYRRVAYARDFGNEHLYGDHGRGCGRPRA